MRDAFASSNPLLNQNRKVTEMDLSTVSFHGIDGKEHLDLVPLGEKFPGEISIRVGTGANSFVMYFKDCEAADTLFYRLANVVRDEMERQAEEAFLGTKEVEMVICDVHGDVHAWQSSCQNAIPVLT